MQHLVLYTVCCIAIFMSLRVCVSAGACIPVPSAYPISNTIQPVLKHCGAHKHSLYIHACDPKQS